MIVTQFPRFISIRDREFSRFEVSGVRVTNLSINRQYIVIVGLFITLSVMSLLVAMPASARAASLHTNLVLPTVGVDTEIINAPLNGRSWDVSHLGSRVGHLEGTSWLGETGNIVIGGHSEDAIGVPSIFASLYDLNVGDPVLLSHEGGQRTYVVSEIRRVDYRDLSVIYPTQREQVTLVTCAVGTFDSAIGNYQERLVVIATPA